MSPSRTETTGPVKSAKEEHTATDENHPLEKEKTLLIISLLCIILSDIGIHSDPPLVFSTPCSSVVFRQPSLRLGH